MPVTLLSRKLFANVNSLFANESDGYKTTSAPSAFSVFLRKECSDRGKSRLPSKVNAFFETAIKKIYLTAEQPDVAAVIEEVQLKCFNAKTETSSAADPTFANNVLRFALNLRGVAYIRK